MLAQALFLLSLIRSALADAFTNPPPSSRVIWRVGDVKTITYKTTRTNYSITLWQQAAGGGAAWLGPVLYQTTNGPGNTFDWLVQTYEFDLSYSNLFFLWLFEGAPPSGKAVQSSSYFRITADEASSSSSTKTSATLTATAPPKTSTASPADAQLSSSSGGLSVGAQAGIGVGGSVAGLGLVGLIVFLLRDRKKQQKMIQEIRDTVQPRAQAEEALKPPTPVEMSGHPPAIRAELA